MKRIVSWLLVAAPFLSSAIAACSDNGEFFGTRSGGGAGADDGGAGSDAGGSAGTTPATGGTGAGGANGGTGAEGANGGTGAGGANGGTGAEGANGGTGAGGVNEGGTNTGGSGEAGGQAGTGGLAGAGGKSTGGASGSGTTGGSAGAHAGAGAGGASGGAGASAGSSGSAGAGSGGGAGAPTCPTDCERMQFGTTCPNGEVWQCAAGYNHQQLIDAGCQDLATGLPRYCCPLEPFAGCVSPRTCAEVTTQVECDARTDCHSVFFDPGDCSCAAIGCCARFSRCADGGQADCDGSNVSCDAATPHCESPAYVVSYTPSCYEGCVKPADCAP